MSRVARRMFMGARTHLIENMPIAQLCNIKVDRCILNFELELKEEKKEEAEVLWLRRHWKLKVHSLGGVSGCGRQVATLISTMMSSTFQSRSTHSNWFENLYALDSHSPPPFFHAMFIVSFYKGHSMWCKVMQFSKIHFNDFKTSLRLGYVTQSQSSRCFRNYQNSISFS